MRRTLPKELASFAPPENAQATASGDQLRLVVPLRTITRTIGGGVVARTPDTIDVVRVPGIRGQLRHFWRLVGDGETDPRPAETRFWGGVAGDGESQASKAGKVRVCVDVRKPGKVTPAGVHVRNQRDVLKPQPDWKGDPNLGYALFPLQRAKEELQAARSRGATELRTADLRQDGVEFDLTFSIQNALLDDVERFVRALWAFVHFGGIGARTSRGFGAISLRERETIRAEGSLEAQWQREWGPRFEAPRPDVAAVEQWLSKHAVWVRLAGLEALAGPIEASAERAQGNLIGALKDFRQGVDIGRKRGRDRREGQSNWPEAHVLRFVYEALARETVDWEHKPPRKEMARYKNEAWYVPRAAFGLPILVKFTGRQDSRANGSIENAKGRWRSPLTLRPVACACADGRSFVPLAVVTGDRVPEDEVEIKLDEKPKGVKAKPKAPAGHNAADSPIRGLLDRAQGDAVDAFLEYLQERGRFRRVFPGGSAR